jgi:hypothetical protein
VGGVIEHDTLQCNHCNAHVQVKPGTVCTVYLVHHPDGRTTEEPGAFCTACMNPICIRCHEVGGVCRPFEQRLDAYEKRHR